MNTTSTDTATLSGLRDAGRRAYRNGESAAPALHPEVLAALVGLPVGRDAMTIMQAFTDGFRAEADSAARAILQTP
jgi:hypothetical protein